MAARELDGRAFMTFLVKKQTWGHRTPSLCEGRGQQIFSRHLPPTRRTTVADADVPRKTACANTPVSSSSSLPIVLSFARSVVHNEMEPTRTIKRLFSCILQFDHLYGVRRPPRAVIAKSKNLLIPLHFAARGYINHDARTRLPCPCKRVLQCT